ncbi:methionine adenosyltransferase [Lepagella muris]|jgi:S-adenosylmethionine synthetase|uniref:Methionine adenosyltransferase n=1 Tax=Lepagella muris TaxID=3032870 RepID=A0AC61RIN4_9BACT|nr:methionine adenosyltransferase [Lepagella muris]TGY77136.1 methionine adenosyltransferase [Lepagella muris]THG49040.1 methionine adenosyltransferase [Bacteroidales bacterium]TKC54615.1 methionine adenosyltransferase [Bacteroidales bacterium]
MSYLFTSESVSEGHPDKVADQISDTLLDEFLARDSESHVAVETLCTTGQVVVAGEVSSRAYVDIHTSVRDLIKKIGYNRGAYRFDGDSLGILSAIHEQSSDIDRGVSRGERLEQGAGDQGMMFGYAVDETDNYMPLTLDLSHLILRELAEIRREGKEMSYYRKGKLKTYLRPDAKSQVTVEYDDNRIPVRVNTIVVSTSHDEFILPLDETEQAQKRADEEMLKVIREDVENVLLPRVIAKLPEKVRALFDDKLILHVNPTGKFVLGGPHADTGLTGRKIIVDTYGGRGAHGGGAFSGKDPSKVDRSAAYACRYIAKNMVAAGVAREMLVQVSYAIGVAEPVNIFVDTYGTAREGVSDAMIADKIKEMFDLRPGAIEEMLKLRNPIYRETAAYGHMGREPRTVVKKFESRYDSVPLEREVELFTWEKTDRVDEVKKAFGIA